MSFYVPSQFSLNVTSYKGFVGLKKLGQPIDEDTDMDDDIKIIIHHGESFETKEDGEVVPLKTGLRALSHNKELLGICFHAKNNEGVVHVYLEHGSTEPEGDEVPQLIPMTPNPKTPVSDNTLNPSSWKKVVGEVPTVTLSSDSSDSYESAKDELFRPGPEAFENSSDDDSDSEMAVARTRELKMKKNKEKHKICLEDLCEEDELIVQNCYEQEIKTPPNSDEESDVDDDIAVALVAAAAALIAKEKEKGSNASDAKEGQSAQDREGENDPTPTTDVATSEAPPNANAPLEIMLSPIPFSLPDSGEQEQEQGESSGTTSRMAEVIEFILTPGVKPAFKPPRKK
ncbi:hypothetical protein Ahy_B08g094122 [Arachis hypogaea]|uniref:Nucleoplasmin-like domain-containing protein n=1 Tax=Arachis hypogaea TaxID=3818 RepID=A0A444Y7W2_ARAHY|nr:hypothetical protein Ahy_B08g094122 [Arachis hypogaea]